MIKIEGIKKYYLGKLALDIDKFFIKNGEIVGIVGNNGAGKTTLLRLILDLIKADSGSIWIDDSLVSESEQWKKYTGSYLDENFLIDFLSPEEFYSFIGKIYHFSDEEIINKLNSFNDFFNNEILNQGRKYIRDYSDGNKQKIGISSALLVNPNVLILDEPFNHLDPTSQIILKKLLIEINSNLGTTILLSSHNLNQITEICSRIVVIKNGHIVMDCINTGAILDVLERQF